MTDRRTDGQTDRQTDRRTGKNNMSPDPVGGRHNYKTKENLKQKQNISVNELTNSGLEDYKMPLMQYLSHHPTEYPPYRPTHRRTPFLEFP